MQAKAPVIVLFIGLKDSKANDWPEVAEAAKAAVISAFLVMPPADVPPDFFFSCGLRFGLAILLGFT